MELRNPIVFIHELVVILLLYEHALLNKYRMQDSPIFCEPIKLPLEVEYLLHQARWYL